MKVEINLDSEKIGGSLKRMIRALHSGITLMLIGAGFAAAAIAFSGWDFPTKLIGWGALFFVPGFFKMIDS